MGFAGRHRHDQVTALQSLWTLLADVAVSKPTSPQAARGGRFSAAIAPGSPAIPRHAGEASPQLPGLTGLASNVVTSSSCSHPPPRASLEQGLFPGCNTFHVALWSWDLPEKRYLPLQELIKMPPSWTVGQSNPTSTCTRRRLGLHAASRTRCPSNKMVNSEAVGKPVEIIMLIMLLSFSNRGNGTLCLERAQFFFKD